MKKWATERSLERTSGQGLGHHGGLSGFNLAVARSWPEFMEEAIQIQALSRAFRVSVPVSE